MRDVRTKLQSNNPWYVVSHLDMYSRNEYRRRVNARKEFILNELISKRSDSGEGIRILDAGCGDGFYFASMLSFEDAKVYGLDYNFLRVSHTRQTQTKGYLFSADLEFISAKNGIFDCILLNQVLEHIEDDVKVLHEAIRVLKPGGMMILGIPNEGCFFATIRNNIFQRSVLKDTDHVNFYTENDIRNKLESCGFRIVRLKRENFVLPHSRLNDLLARFKYGYMFLDFLGQLFKSQCGGLLFVCSKKDKNSL